ncbi:4,5-dioxygenase [Vineibacter terrae]|uniref:4,5-dioxygenase n=1 Tax=Vineibacter terrae TaxID=2586908 RepID=A0A5C8PJR1_9HYPH|nr:DOPA 4,5-dioxygenase family protein [Vineibacter terrae]TXL74076.1 4,5-dioxygenase [Vineibacter terrae]
MKHTDTSVIESWHAHVYFDAASRDAAWSLREAIMQRFDGAMEMGRFHERPVGPHPRWSYQVAFKPDRFSEIVAWLALNRGELVVFTHPNTGDALVDHRDRAIWMGAWLELNLDALRDAA